MSPHCKIGHLFSKGNAEDHPLNPIGTDMELCAAQIETRLAEIEKTFYMLAGVVDIANSGERDSVLEQP